MAEGDPNTQPPDRPLLQQALLQPVMAAPGTKKKSSSFQITSVTVGSRLSNDGGDDSADEAEDVSEIVDGSRVNDEDEDDDDSKAPVIPTSTQYGIYIDSNYNSGDLPDGVTVNMTESGLALGVPVGVQSPQGGKSVDELNQWQSRFRVVKIETIEPIRRGRWVCTDYMDQPAIVDEVGQKDLGSENSSNASSVNHVPSDSVVVASDTGVSSHPAVEKSSGVDSSVSPPTTMHITSQTHIPQQANSGANANPNQFYPQDYPPSSTSTVGAPSTSQSQIPEFVSVGAQTVVATSGSVTQAQSATPASLSASLANIANHTNSSNNSNNNNSISQSTVTSFPQVTVVNSVQTVVSPNQQPAVAAVSASTSTATTASANGGLLKTTVLPPGIIDQPTPLLDQLEEVTNGGGLQRAEGGSDESASSGGSTVAIDNKIEQAMDLVKSHLMFAVREEVEVLKEKITELVDRIQLLETENTILKSNASQETLAQLPQLLQNPPTQQSSPPAPVAQHHQQQGSQPQPPPASAPGS